MSGAGNDFVVIDNRKGSIRNAPELAQKLCDRRWGIGADGLLLVETSENADYRMMYYNADGSYGGMCGNGGRCIALYTESTGIAKRTQSFEALGHIYNAKVEMGTVKLAMKDPTELKLNIVLPVNLKRIKVHFIDTGSPHVVIPVQNISRTMKSVDNVDVESLGHAIRHHKKFQPDGTNVNFIERHDANSIKMRTYERGVEGETLACGTGSVASAILAALLWKMNPPITVLTRSNQDLLINFSAINGTIRDVTLTGPATVTFDGFVEI